MNQNERELILEKIKKYSVKFNPEFKETYIILAAGHGKRIKSNTSKMLHKIWGKTTVERVMEACNTKNSNIIVVVGIKAAEVIEELADYNNLIFAYQEEQKGTGHAVQVALEAAGMDNYEGTVFVLPGDMGLIDTETMQNFAEKFYLSGKDMIVLTGKFSGDHKDNYYGRIVRAKDRIMNVLGIVECKDIISLREEQVIKFDYSGKDFSYTKNELFENREYNSGVYAFRSKHLIRLINEIKNNNSQNELYITDLIYIFNKNGLLVDATMVENEEVIMGFNTKSVLNEMNIIARKNFYEKIKDIVEIEDCTDFYISDNIVDDFIERDKNGEILDIKIGKGVYLSGDIKIESDVKLGRNVKIAGSKINIGTSTKIGNNSIIEGNVSIGENVWIDNNCQLYGEVAKPLIIGENVAIYSNCFVRNSLINSDTTIENSRIENCEAGTKDDKTVIKNVIPKPEGVNYLK